MYNSFAVGFEQPGLLHDSFQAGQPAAELNTIGVIAQAARKFSKTHGLAGLGVHLAIDETVILLTSPLHPY